ncbi:MAG: VCBS repeat-containing protein [Planctomycetes bacterium]|nr:VCBS repeat-containing protein [Planctomycetota bacterium]
MSGRSVVLSAAGVIGVAAWSALLWRPQEAARPPPPLAVPAATEAAREWAAALFDEERYDDAQQLLEAVVARRDAQPADHVRLGQLFFARWVKRGSIDTPAEVVDGWAGSAREHCQKGLALSEKQASGHYVIGVLAARWAGDGTPDDALAPLRRALALAPDDLGTQVHLAVALEDTGDRKAALAQFAPLLERGKEFLGVWHRTVLYRTARLLLRTGSERDAARGKELLAELAKLPEPESKTKDEQDALLGELGRIRLAGSPSGGPAPRPARVTWGPPEAWSDGARGAVRAFAVADLDGDRRDDLAWIDDEGLACTVERGGERDAQRIVQRVAAGDFAGVVAAEVENGGAASLFAFGRAGLSLFTPAPLAAPPLPRFVDESAALAAALPPDRTVDAVTPVDFNHDGHLDLLLVVGGELRLIESGGVPRASHDGSKVGTITFRDATSGSGLEGRTARFTAIEDFDGDHDVDLLSGGPEAPTLLWSNLRRGRFEARDAAATGLPDRLAEPPLLADLDDDGVPDLLVGGAAPKVHRGDGALRFTAAAAPAGGARERLAGATWCDADLDGRGEWVDAAAVSDLDLDADLDAIDLVEGALQVRRGALAEAPRRALLLLRGRKDNRFATGAVVEVRAGGRYQRRFVRSPVQLFGFAGGDEPIVRITWTDGVTQHALQDRKREDVAPLDAAAARAVHPIDDVTLWVDLSGDVRLELTQKKGPPGSCPFLYFWNGTRYEFLTDVLGATPLGLPIDGERFVQPDHDELVRLAPGSLQPVDGELRFQLTEELREVTYLDRVGLWAVDHAADVLLHPEERFCFPPFPPRRLHALRHVQPLARVVDQAGRDWTRELALEDDRPAIPFTPLPETYRGIATLHALDLTLPEAARAAKRVRLLCSGWLQWGDASVNVAAARNGSVTFLPPLLSQPDGAGGWRACGPPLGFPAGKTKTMVVDVTEWVDRADLRLRLTSTLELYWDAFAVALDGELGNDLGNDLDATDAPITVTKLEPTVARLWERGFSRPLPRERWQAERYDWEQLEAIARFDQHRGLLTRYGDVRPLLDAADDRYVLLSSGDALDLRFAATALPPLPAGMVRTWLLDLDGWAKDGDANTASAQTVLPLPFHAMSGYPYRADEQFPDDALHRDWQREWNTRPGRRLLPPLAAPIGSGAALGGIEAAR